MCFEIKMEENNSPLLSRMSPIMFRSAEVLQRPKPPAPAVEVSESLRRTSSSQEVPKAIGNWSRQNSGGSKRLSASRIFLVASGELDDESPAPSSPRIGGHKHNRPLIFRDVLLRHVPVIVSIGRSSDYIAVGEGDFVDVLDASGLRRGEMAVQTQGGRRGVIPRHALHITPHTSNIYIGEIYRILRPHPHLVATICESDFPLWDFVQILLVASDKEDAVEWAFQMLMAMENTHEQPLRADSPVISLIAAFREQPAIQELRRSIVEKLLNLLNPPSPRSSNWGRKKSGSILNTSVERLADICFLFMMWLTQDVPPPELCVLIKGLASNSNTKWELITSCICLRLFAPAIAQPADILNRPLPPEITVAMGKLAKMIQISANQVAPLEESPFHSAKQELEKMGQIFTRWCQQMVLGCETLPIPTHSLVLPAVELYRRLYYEWAPQLEYPLGQPPLPNDAIRQAFALNSKLTMI